MFLSKVKGTVAGLLVAGLLISGVVIAGRSAMPHASPTHQPGGLPPQQTPGQNQGKAPASRVPAGVALRTTLEGHTNAVCAVAFSPDGKRLAAGDEDGSIKIWDVAAGKSLQTLAAHQKMVVSVAFSPDGTLLASACSSHERIDPANPIPDAVSVWDVASGKVKVELKGNAGWFRQVAFSPDGNVLAATTHAGRAVKLWETATGKELGTLVEERGLSIQSMTFRPHGQTLVLAMDNSLNQNVEPIRLWNWSERKPVGTLKVDGSCYFAAFSRDGETLLTLSHPGDLTIWDFEKSAQRKSINLKWKAVPYGAMTLAPNGKTLALGFRVSEKKGESIKTSGKVELRDAMTAELVETIKLDRSQSAFAFSPTSGLVAVGCRGKEERPKVGGFGVVEGGAGVIQLWEVPALTK